MRIALLHTAASNIAVFDAAAPPGVTLTHILRPDLLAEAEAAGGATPEILARTAAVVAAAALTADAVLVTCTTLGAVGGPRLDAMLAEAVAARGGGIVLCTAPTTLAPTAAVMGAATRTRLIPGAWALFSAGNHAGYLAAIAAAADAAFDEDPVVALAQASMAPAAALCTRGVPLTAPAVALARMTGVTV
ncbi:hypothetical protein ACQW02_22720 [Humitalea sp. 24SJ18S-53]|uniref:hypothetical protein n=1 Tax=Humitalea sp. 24SJ18S-53 TaxID=3422307 RepID=UPI003D66454A